MRIDITVYASTAAEARAALNEAANAIPLSSFVIPGRGFRVEVTPEYLLSEAIAGADAGGVLEAAPEAEAAPAAPRRGRRTKAQIEADEKAQIEADEKAQIEADEKAQIDGPAPSQDAGTDAAMSPVEAKNKALEILRTCYQTPDGPAALKKVSAQFQVTKFAEIADDKGHALLGCALALQSQLQLAQPADAEIVV